MITRFYNPEEVPIPNYSEVLLFRNKLDGFLYYKTHSGQSILVKFENGIFYIPDKTVIRVINYTSENVESILFSNGILLRFFIIPNVVIEGGGGGSRGSQGAQGAQGPQGAGGGGSGVTSVTYTQLINLAGSNSLVPGSEYLLSDFATREIIPNTADIKQGGIEPLILHAATVSTINENAISTLFPQDIIYYELVDSSTSGGDKGRIYFREDTINRNSTWYDWRVCVFRRWETAPGSGIFTVITNNGGASQDYYTFNNSPSAVNCNDTSIGGLDALSGKTDGLNNIVFFGKAQINTFGPNCYDCTFTGTGALLPNVWNNSIGSQFYGNTVGELFYSNNINTLCSGNVIADTFTFNNIGISFTQNTIGNNFQFNSIQDNFSLNTIGLRFQRNEAGSNFNNNTIGNDCIGNTISDLFNVNVVGNNFKDNTIGSNFNNNNPIRDNFIGNTISTGFSTNSTGIDFINNVIGSSCVSNVIGDRFQENDVQGNYSGNAVGIDFLYNQIGFGFTGNTILDNFEQNIIKDNFANNNIRSGCILNFIGSNFSNNTIVNNFRKNTICNLFTPTGVDFSLSTFVYADYQKEIFENSANVFRLRYTDNADTIIYVNPSA